jgi:hypothetical protein
LIQPEERKLQRLGHERHYNKYRISCRHMQDTVALEQNERQSPYRANPLISPWLKPGALRGSLVS